MISCFSQISWNLEKFLICSSTYWKIDLVLSFAFAHSLDHMTIIWLTFYLFVSGLFICAPTELTPILLSHLPSLTLTLLTVYTAHTWYYHSANIPTSLIGCGAGPGKYSVSSCATWSALGSSVLLCLAGKQISENSAYWYSCIHS